MVEVMLAINVVVVLCLIVAVVSFWRAAVAAEETQKIAAKISTRFDSLEKRKGN
jgi:hypothetical protein